MSTTLRRYSGILLVIILFTCEYSNAQIVYQETFTTSVSTANATTWNNFRAALTPRAYNKLVVKRNGVPVDSVTTPSIVQSMAMGLNTANATAPTTQTWVVGSNTWYLGACGSSVEWGIGPSTPTPCACAVVRVIRAACTTCGTNYGGWDPTLASTCPGPNPFVITVEFWYGYPCTDTPKSSVRGPKLTCPNKSYLLQPDSFYSDASYKWEYSLNGNSWSNFTGTPGAVGEITDSINTGAKYYRVTITCVATPSLKWTSPPHKVEVAPFYYCYCATKVTDDKGADIGNLIITKTNTGDTILNTSTLATGLVTPVYNNSNAVRAYTAYQDSVAWPCLYRDSTYSIRLAQVHSTASFQQTFVQAYIDFNRDGLYNPNTEKVFIKKLDGTATPPEVLKTNITIPAASEIGLTGMRIVMSRDSVQAAPCDTISGYGEIEDYVVELCHRPCTGPVNSGVVISTDTSMCTGYEYTLRDTSYEKALSAFSRAWQVSGDNVTWFNINNSQNKDTLERSFTGQPLYYRVRTICLPTYDTAYSTSTLINLKPGYKCYCYSKANGGTGVDSSDIGGMTIANYSSNAGGPHLLNAAAVRPRTDFTDITPIELFTDSVYKFYVYHTMPVVEHGDAKVTIFMDFNNNHVYDIPEERIYTGYTTIGNHTLVDNVIVPVNAIVDVPTGMRVILNNDVGPNIPSDEACGPYTSGETEDYLLVFRKKHDVGVAEADRLNDFNIHPNPTTGKVYVQFSTNAAINDLKVKVTNVTGQLIQEHTYDYKGGIFYQEINMSNQAKGVYFVELESDGQKMMKKLVVQ